MTEQEFRNKRKPFYIDPETSLIKFPTSRHMDSSCAVWFHEMGIPFTHTVRGYYWKDDESEFIMLYWNEFAVPNIVFTILTYIFEYFPSIQWIGMGCYIGKPGEMWKPIYKIYRNKP